MVARLHKHGCQRQCANPAEPGSRAFLCPVKRPAGNPARVPAASRRWQTRGTLSNARLAPDQQADRHVIRVRASRRSPPRRFDHGQQPGGGGIRVRVWVLGCAFDTPHGRWPPATDAINPRTFNRPRQPGPEPASEPCKAAPRSRSPRAPARNTPPAAGFRASPARSARRQGRCSARSCSRNSRS